MCINWLSSFHAISDLRVVAAAGKAPSGRIIPISGNESNYTPLAQTVPASDRQEAVRQAASSTASAMETLLQALPKRCGSVLYSSLILLR